MALIQDATERARGKRRNRRLFRRLIVVYTLALRVGFAKTVAMDGWRFGFNRVSGPEELQREALCVLGNGYWAVRGAAPELAAGAGHYPGNYVAGVYNRVPSMVAGEWREDESLVNLPNWLLLTFAIGDGPWFGEGDFFSVQDEQHELDIQAGVLTRTIRVRDQNGRETKLVQSRFVHIELRHVAAIRMTVTALNWSGAIRLRSEIDATIENRGVDRYRGLTSRHLRVLASEHVAAGLCFVTVRTTQSGIEIALASSTTVQSGGGEAIAGETTRAPAGAVIGHEFTLECHRDQPVTVNKIVSIATSRDRGISDLPASVLNAQADCGDFDSLFSSHQQGWSRLWARFRVDVAPNPIADPATVRLCLFHVIQATYAAGPDGLDVGIPARGLHGEAYRGHIFWDELFVLPFLTSRLPQLARSLLTYRYRRLPAARRAAREAGLEGALFPWQSGSDGRDETPAIHLNPASGRWLPDITRLQRHVGLAVAFNVWKYYLTTGDLEFLEDRGAEVILEVARCFASLADYDPSLSRFVIRGVIGPDEFHTGYPGQQPAGIDNNAYTNVMTSWLLTQAEKCLSVLPEPRRSELITRLGITPAERERWAGVGSRLHVPFHADGLISQFDGYEQLAEFDWPAYRSRYTDVSRLDRILESEGDDVNRYKVSKQADVLMLFYLLTAEELTGLFSRLDYAWNPSDIPRTIEYYLQRTSGGSSLSAVVASWVLSRSHRSESDGYLVRTLRADMDKVSATITGEGIHLAAMCGAADVLQRCFAGIEITMDGLSVNPSWREGWGAAEFAIQYRLHSLRVCLVDGGIEITDVGGPPTAVVIDVKGDRYTLPTGGSVRIGLD